MKNSSRFLYKNSSKIYIKFIKKIQEKRGKKKYRKFVENVEKVLTVKSKM